MRVQLLDEVVDNIASRLRPGESVEKEIERRLIAAEDVRPREQFVTLCQAELDAVAERIGTGLPIRSKADLLRAIDQVARITLGDVRLVFTPNQLGQIEERAKKIGETPERFVARVAAKLLMDVFLVEPAPEGVLYTPGFDPDDSVEDAGLAHEETV